MTYGEWQVERREISCWISRMSSSLPSRSMCLTATDWPVRLSRARYTIPKEPPEKVLLLEVVQTRVKPAIDALTSQLLQHMIVVRRHFVWYFLLRRVSTRTTVPYSAAALDPCSSPRPVRNAGDNDKHSGQRPHTTRGSNKQKHNTQGSMEEAVWYCSSNSEAEGGRCWRVGCLNIVWRCPVRIGVGQCPAACPSSAGSSVDLVVVFTIATLSSACLTRAARCAHACVSS